MDIKYCIILSVVFAIVTIVALLGISFIFIGKKGGKNQVFLILSVILHVITLTFSIIAISVCCPRNVEFSDLGFDYIGVIVGIISLLVAVLIGWNIYTVVDFNKKTEIIEGKAEVIKVEYQKLKNDYQELEKSLKYTQSDITFSSIFNNTRILEREANDNFVQCIFDGYMDALNVAIQDKLADDRVEIVLTGLINLTNRNANLIKNRFPILPNRYEYYYKILLNDRLTGERANRMKTFIKDSTIEVYTGFPPTYVRVISKYNPDYIAPKSNTK